MKFEKEDRLILESYKTILEGFSEFVGPSCEIVLHSLEDIDHSAIKVINGHFSGRSEGAPITDIALKMLTKIETCNGNKKNMIYPNATPSGEPIRSATLPIMGKGDKIIGLICINMYLNLPIHIYLDSIFNVQKVNDDSAEIFASSTGELILHTLEECKIQIQNNVNVSSNNKNKEIIHALYEKEIFNFKEAVQIIARALGISKNTVYLHLRNLSKS